jgi:hypothetical protein
MQPATAIYDIYRHGAKRREKRYFPEFPPLFSTAEPPYLAYPDKRQV